MHRPDPTERPADVQGPEPRCGERVRAVRLTPTERRVIRLRALGFTDRETADRMGIAEQTVKNHVRNARERNAQDSFVGLLIALGWLEVPEA